MHWLLLSFILCLPNCCMLLELNYSWRDYFGTIPSDAVVAGQNVAGNNVYIGQGYVQKHGLGVAQINPGEKVYVPFGSRSNLAKYVKILCGAQQNFFWINVNTTSVYDILLDKAAVFGGHDDVIDTVMRVARINIGGDTVVGRCTPGPNRQDYFHYEKDGKELVFNGAYQVLIYKDYKKVVEVL